MWKKHCPLPLSSPSTALPYRTAFCSLWRGGKKFFVDKFFTSYASEENNRSRSSTSNFSLKQRLRGKRKARGRAAAHCPCGACYAAEQRRWQGVRARLVTACLASTPPRCLCSSPFILVVRAALCCSYYSPLHPNSSSAIRIYYYFYIVINHS